MCHAPPCFRVFSRVARRFSSSGLTPSRPSTLVEGDLSPGGLRGLSRENPEPPALQAPLSSGFPCCGGGRDTGHPFRGPLLASAAGAAGKTRRGRGCPAPLHRRPPCQERFPARHRLPPTSAGPKSERAAVCGGMRRITREKRRGLYRNMFEMLRKWKVSSQGIIYKTGPSSFYFGLGFVSPLKNTLFRCYLNYSKP